MVDAAGNAFREIENADEGFIGKEIGGFEAGDGEMMFDVGLGIGEGEGFEGIADGDALIEGSMGGVA